MIPQAAADAYKLISDAVPASMTSGANPPRNGITSPQRSAVSRSRTTPVIPEAGSVRADPGRVRCSSPDAGPSQVVRLVALLRAILAAERGDASRATHAPTRKCMGVLEHGRHWNARPTRPEGQPIRDYRATERLPAEY